MVLTAGEAHLPLNGGAVWRGQINTGMPEWLAISVDVLATSVRMNTQHYFV